MVAGQVEQQPRQVSDVGLLIDGEGTAGRLHQRVEIEGVEHSGRASGLLHEALQELPLVGNTVQVAARGLAAPNVTQRHLAVSNLAAGLNVEAGERVIDGVLGADLHTVNGVGHVGEATQADLHVVVDVHAGGLLNGFHQQLRTAEGEGGVDLAHVVAGDVDVGVARDGHQDALPTTVRDVHQHDGVGALRAQVASGFELLLLAGRHAGAGVGADQQPVGSAGAADHVFA